jgi:hypothetical protein
MNGSFKLVTGILLVIFIFGVVIGMNVAEQNLHKMQGIEGAPKAIQVTPVDGKVEIAVLGETIKTENPIQKLEKPNQGKKDPTQVDSKSWLTEAGSTIGNSLRIITRTILDLIFAN